MSKENIKVICSLDDTFQSDKFLKLRLKVCHDGTNKNNCSFTLDSFEKAKKSIELIPILANVIQDENGEYQFSGHDMSIVENAFDENSTKIIYKEVPVGFVPTNCNYELVQEDDRTYVFVDGFVWKEYSNYAEEIIKRDEVINLSMEILVNDVSSNNDSATMVNIIDFIYTGITLLGNDVEPAMYNACAKLINFSLDKSVDEVVREMSSQLDEIVNEMSTKSTFSENDVVENIVKDVQIETQSEDETTNVNRFEKFSINLDMVISQINEYLEVIDKNNEYSSWSFMCEFANDYFVYNIHYCDDTLNRFFKVAYCINADNSIRIDENSTIEVFNMLLTSDERDNILSLRTSYDDKVKEVENLNKQIEELSEFKKNVLQKELETQLLEVIDKWSSALEDCEKFNELKDNMCKYSVEELEIQCKCLFADKQMSLLKTIPVKKEESSKIVEFSLNNQPIEKSQKNEKELVIAKFLNK